MMPPVSSAPLHGQRSSRIPSLDVLRGVALLGALPVSVWIAGGISLNQQRGLLTGGHGWNFRMYEVVSMLAEGKMRGLISLVFGACMLLFFADAKLGGRLPPADLFIRRQLWLMVLGLVNALLLLWTGDLLFHLGIMGILLFPFMRLPAKGLLVAACVATLIYCAKNYWNYADDRAAYNTYLTVTALEKKFAKAVPKKDSLSNEQKADKQAWEGILNTHRFDAKADQTDIKEIRNTKYTSVWFHLLSVVQSRQSQWTYHLGIWDMSSMILLGMALMKRGFFTGQFSKKNYLLTALVGISAGLLLAWSRLHYQQVALHDYTAYVRRYLMPYDLLFPVERAFVAAGYASAVLLLLQAGFMQAGWRVLAAAGRMALTNYMVQGLAFTLFFKGFGMGYYGRLEQYQLYLFATELAMVQIVCSTLWLRRYNTGPVEWLWHCLLEAKWLPLRTGKLAAGAAAFS